MAKSYESTLDLILSQKPKLVKSPACMGCFKTCIHNTAVMADWKAEQVRGINGCNTLLESRVQAMLKYKLMEKIADAIKTSKDVLRSLS